MGFRILGTGSYLPDKVVTNDDMASIVETSDEWINQRVGVRERRISVTQSASDLALEAAKRALENADVNPGELDLIICATITNDNVCPTAAGSVQRGLGATCPAFDINSACSGFLFALETADGFFARRTVKKVLVIGAERVSKIVNWTDRSTCVIFGDGAGAAVLGEGNNYLASKIHTEGGDEVIEIPNYGGDSPFYKKETKKPFILMEGQETFKFAVNAMTEGIKEVLAKAGLTSDDVDHVVPHQANIRIIHFACSRLKIPESKFAVNLDKYGNTSSASVPIALDELNQQGKLKRGDIIALAAFGGGLSSAACIIKY